jgi:hypothetical protein
MTVVPSRVAAALVVAGWATLCIAVGTRASDQLVLFRGPGQLGFALVALVAAVVLSGRRASFDRTLDRRRRDRGDGVGAAPAQALQGRLALDDVSLTAQGRGDAARPERRGSRPCCGASPPCSRARSATSRWTASTCDPRRRDPAPRGTSAGPPLRARCPVFDVVDYLGIVKELGPAGPPRRGVPGAARGRPRGPGPAEGQDVVGRHGAPARHRPGPPAPPAWCCSTSRRPGSTPSSACCCERLSRLGERAVVSTHLTDGRSSARPSSSSTPVASCSAVRRRRSWRAQGRCGAAEAPVGRGPPVVAHRRRLVPLHRRPPRGPRCRPRSRTPAARRPAPEAVPPAGPPGRGHGANCRRVERRRAQPAAGRAGGALSPIDHRDRAGARHPRRRRSGPAFAVGGSSGCRGQHARRGAAAAPATPRAPWTPPSTGSRSASPCCSSPWPSVSGRSAQEGQETEMPPWMATSTRSPRRALVLGLMLSGANPRTWP